jgi:hypothetical protein
VFGGLPAVSGWQPGGGGYVVAISTRSSDVRVAQQLGMLANLPSLAVIVLIAYGIIHPTLAFALAAAALLLVLSALGWRVASALFDAERLITGTR